jgi:hypothetical protein
MDAISPTRSPPPRRSSAGAGRAARWSPSAFVLAVALAAPGLAQAPRATCFACNGQGAVELRAGYSDADWTRLLAGEVLSELLAGAEGQGRARASAVFPAPAERIWAVLTDWERYPGFMPNVQETRLRRREGERAWISQHLRVAWTDVRYGVVWNMAPDEGLVRFALDPGEPADIAHTEGSWRLAPFEEPDRTLVLYELETDVGRPVPGFIRDTLSRRSLPRVVRGVRDEVARRAAAP